MSKPYTFDRVVRMIITVAVIAMIVWLINVLKNVLLPFCLACLLAYMLQPLVEFNQNRLLRGRWHVLAVFMALVEAAVAIGLVAWFCIPSVINEMTQMGDLIKTYQARKVSIPFVPSNVHQWLADNVNEANLAKIIEEGHVDTIISRGTTLLGTIVAFLMHTLEWLLTFIYVIFILIDYRQLMTGLRLLIPPRYRPMAAKIGTDIKNSMSHYFRGQAIIACCAAVFYAVGFSIVGMPLAIVMGVIVGVLYMIPYFQYVTLIPVAIICMIHSMGGGGEFWTELGQCCLVYVVSQCICDYILTPKIMGKAMGLNPAIILLSLSVWGTLLGLIGMIIALPLTALLLSYYSEYVIHRGSMPESEKLRMEDTLDKITHSSNTPHLDD